MQTQWVLTTAEQVARGLSHDVNSVQLRHKLDGSGSDTALSLDQFVGHLREIGEAINLTFFQNSTSRAAFQELVGPTLVNSILFAWDAATGIRPYVVTNSAWDKLQGLTVSSSGEFTEPWEFSAQEAASRFLSKMAVNAATESQPEGQEIAGDDSVFFITTLAVGSLVSSQLVNQMQEQGKKHTPLVRLWQLFRSERKDVSQIYIYALLAGILSLALPLGVQTIIGLVSGGLILEPVVILITFVVVGTIMAGALQIMQAYIVENLQQRIFAKASFEMALRIPRMQLEAMSNKYAPELMNRFFDVQNIQKGFAKLLTDFIAAVLQIFFGVLLLAFYHPYFIFFSLVMLVLLFIIFRYTGAEALQTSLDESKYKYKTANWVQEMARTLMSLKNAGDTQLPVSKMDELVSGYLEKRKKHFKILLTQYGSILAFKVLVTGGLLVLGSILVVNRQITLGQFVASELVVILVLTSVEKIVLSLDTIYDTITATEKVGQMTDVPLDDNHGINLKQETGSSASGGLAIELKHVAYTHPGKSKPSLTDITLNVQAGQRVGIVAAAGAGATTLLSLICGMRPSYSGVITFDGISLRDINVRSLQADIGICLSTDEVFDGTVFENISLGRAHIGPVQVLKAIQQTGLTGWAERQAKGLQTHILAGGKGLPGYVLKKLLMARAIVHQPRLVLVDDMLNHHEENYLRELHSILLDRKEKFTVLAVNHDPDFLRQCDIVLLLAEGKVVAAGSYTSLIHLPQMQALVSSVTV